MVAVEKEAADGRIETVRVHSQTWNNDQDNENEGQGSVVPFTEWYDALLFHPELRTGLLLEEMVGWNTEVSCLSIAGGQLIVLGSKGPDFKTGPEPEPESDPLLTVLVTKRARVDSL